MAAIVRALPPILDFSTFFPVTPIDDDLTKASMLSNFQFLNSKQIQQAPSFGNSNGLESIDTWKSWRGEQIITMSGKWNRR